MLYVAIYLLQGSESPKMSTLPRLARKSPAQEVVSPINPRPDLLCDMLDEPTKGANMRSLAEAIDEEVELSSIY